MTITNTSVRSRQVQSKKGFTLTEIAIVLGIIGLILGAIWVAASSVYSNQKIAKANSQIIAIAQAIISMHSTQATIANAAGIDLTQTMIRAGVFPSDMLDTGDSNNATAAGTRHPWSGSGVNNVLLYSAQVVTPGDSFQIKYRVVPRTACINLLTSMTGTGRSSSLMMATGAATAAVAYTPYVATVFPVTAATAAGLCAGNNTDLSFVFMIKG